MSADRANEDPLVINIFGERVSLGPLRRDLIPHYQRWLNDLRHARNFDDTPEPWTRERAVSLFEMRAAPAADTAIFTIYEAATLCPIGYTMLFDISYRHRSAEFAIHIGEDQAQRRGYGTETARLMLRYAFQSLGLQSVFLTVAEFNLAGRNAYARAGFHESGRRRMAWRMGGRFWDEIIMDCLAGEFDRPPSASSD